MFGVVLASDTLATTTVTFVGTLFDGFIVFSSTVVNDTKHKYKNLYIL